MDLEATIVSELLRMRDSGEIEQQVKAKAKELIEKSINDAFSSYGPIGTSINKTIKENIKIDLRSVTFDEYNTMLSHMVKRIAFEHMEEQAQKVLGERLDEILTPMPSEMTVQDIADMCVEYWAQDDYFNPNDVAMIIDHTKDASTTIKIYKDGVSTYGSPDVDAYIHNNKILIPRFNSTVWPKNTSFDIESKIYQMFCSGTTITDAHTAESHDIYWDN